MNRQTALRQQLRSHVHALAGVLRLPHGDPREVWRLADAVLDAHDATGDDLLELRAEVVWVMHQVAARRTFNADEAAARLLDGAAAIPGAAVPATTIPIPPRFRVGRPREVACCE